VRIGEAVAATFVILYVTTVRHVPLPIFGVLYALQNLVSLAAYMPAARLADVIGSRVLVAATFACFSLFPVAVVWAPGTAGLVLAFVIGGLKEFGEPARKALIVDLCHPASRAREVGAYYAVRNLLVVPGGLGGGFLWARSPQLVFAVAGVLSAAGLVLFAIANPAASADSGRRSSADECETPSALRRGSY
jgi:MFS family permease